MYPQTQLLNHTIWVSLLICSYFPQPGLGCECADETTGNTVQMIWRKRKHESCFDTKRLFQVTSCYQTNSPQSASVSCSSSGTNFSFCVPNIGRKTFCRRSISVLHKGHSSTFKEQSEHVMCPQGQSTAETNRDRQMQHNKASSSTESLSWTLWNGKTKNKLCVNND